MALEPMPQMNEMHGSPTFAVFGVRRGATLHNNVPRPLVPFVSRPECEPKRCARRTRADESTRARTSRPSMGFCALRRLRKRVATCVGLPSPDCAAPTGFLNLLTLPSTRNPPALFHAGNAPGLLLSEDSPSR